MILAPWADGNLLEKTEHDIDFALHFIRC